MTRWGPPATGLVLLLVLVTACSGPDVRSSPFPSRPGDLPVGRLSACDALSAEQRSELGVGPGQRDAPEATSDSCTWRSDISQFWGVRLQPQNPIAQFDPQDPLFVGASEGYQDPRITTVDGYGAVEFRYSLTGVDPSCNLAIDAGATATVVVDYTDNVARDPRRPTTSIEQRCAIVARAASMVITTMRARASG
ncbi:DUF3558 family protein [Pseudonocardia sp. KRD291]|uniref:DUF3558 family protein n=1 Tax=Pseudonocardia sp. KRD291 TaxID=2792007 RepID=UPI001C49FFF3|nr:DUF3558 family protein [Pseudonocardia sp. KRD291]MBW0103758.1 DUF3558 family protein [Pseudonocardia sp. KRD291]